ncbi:MAG: ATP-binding protein [Roseiflexaceae bacterium]
MFRSLRGQLAVTILTVLALGLGLLLIMAGNQMAQMTMEAFRHEQQVFALVLANTLPESFETPRAQQLMSALTAHRLELMNDIPADTNVSMFDTRGALIASSASTGNGGQPVDLRAVLSGAMVSNTVGGRLYTAVPVTHEGRGIIGVIQIDSSLDSVNARLATRWMALMGAAGAALLFAFLVALWLAGQLTRPLSELRGVAQQMAEGQLDARAEVGDTVTELAALGATFNTMAERVGRMIQEQRDFVANASHELRAPLSAIKLRAEALAYQTVRGERAQRYAAEINDQASELAQLINGLLQLSRAESGAFVLPSAPIHVADELDAYVRAVQPRLTQRQQQLDLQVSDDIPDVCVHPSDLAIMVGNLLDNAIKYTAAGGAISLRAAWNAGKLEIAVRDTGEGIPPEDLPRIAERFFRVDRAHARNIPGVGLGLALVTAVVGQYNGTLRITSAGVPGHGSQAELEIPAPSADPATQTSVSLRCRPGER